MLVGDIGHLRSVASGTLQVVAHDDQIHIVADHQDRIFQGLPFWGAGRRSIRETDHSASQAVDRSLKAQSGTRRRLKKQRSGYFAFEQFSVGVFLKLPGIIQDPKNVLFGTLIDWN